MEFEFFEHLSKRDAKALLQRFIEVESSHFPEIVKQCAAQRIKLDFSIKSLEPFICWVLKKMTTVSKKPDPAVPEWIRNTESYTKNLFDFDEASGVLILRTAYYLGETFVRSYGGLQWGIGRWSNTNRPVVRGFLKGMELPPILVTDTLLSAVIGSPSRKGEIKECLDCWKDLAPTD
jgi:hypothetical protein